MEKYEFRDVMKKEKVVTEILCDGCKRVIAEDRKAVWKTHFKVSTSHHRWGNDSVESMEHHDFCSLECLSADINEYYKEGADTDEYEVSLIKYSF